MKFTMEVELQPFPVPDVVRVIGKTGKREDGFSETPSFPLRDLDPQTLDLLCEEFRTEVFRKAGKEQPPKDTAHHSIVSFLARFNHGEKLQ